MATLRHVEIANVRNHTNYACDLSPHVTLIHGPNGAGKTSLLEAIYLSAQGVSFKSTDRDMITEGQQWYRVDVRDDTGLVRKIVYDNRGERPVKSLTIDGKKHARMPAAARLPIVIFEPDDLRLVHGSPTRRRQYLDRLLAQLDPRYGTQLRRYARALLQRNRLLKRAVTPDQIFPWDVILSDTAAFIIDARIRLTQQLDQLLSDYYQQIAGDDVGVTIAYSRTAVTSHQLIEAYRQTFERDRLLGSTSVGPHRDDVRITYAGRPADRVVSRGENRTITLALKYIEAHLLEQTYGQTPIILLDDVFGELDESRQRNLIHTFTRNQVVVTATHSVDMLPVDTKTILLRHRS